MTPVSPALHPSLSVYFFFLGDISPALCSLLSHCSRTQHRDPSVARSRPPNVANTELPSHSEPDDQKQTTKTNTAFACERIPSVAADVALKSLQSFLFLPSPSLSFSLWQSLATRDRCDPERGAPQAPRGGKCNWITPHVRRQQNNGGER